MTLTPPPPDSLLGLLLAKLAIAQKYGSAIDMLILSCHISIPPKKLDNFVLTQGAQKLLDIKNYMVGFSYESGLYNFTSLGNFSFP